MKNDVSIDDLLMVSPCPGKAALLCDAYCVYCAFAASTSRTSMIASSVVISEWPRLLRLCPAPRDGVVEVGDGITFDACGGDVSGGCGVVSGTGNIGEAEEFSFVVKRVGRGKR